MLVLFLPRCYTFLELPCLRYWLSILPNPASPGLPLVTNPQHNPTHRKTHKSVTHPLSQGNQHRPCTQKGT